MWLVTAGPTREHLDEVRYLSNASSGRMGYAIARAAAGRGHRVVLVSGPVALAEPEGVLLRQVSSACEMLQAARVEIEGGRFEALIGAAAVCDFRPAQRLPGKPSKEQGARRLALVGNPDVVAELAGRAGFALGFALEDLGDLEAAEARARAKLERKGLDAMVLNGVEAIDAEQHRAWWLPRGGATELLGSLPKAALAGELVRRIEAALER
ncbi:MAG: phosphopantothenoylcysteine decarboxylase [Planctomycetota bacterium]